jgi:hypothetical protein
MSTPYHRIEGHLQVLDAFGYWPSFHDAEILSLLLDRSAVLFEGIADARLELSLHAFEWTRSDCPAFNHHLVQFRFHDLEEVALSGFNHQNAILMLKIADEVRGDDRPSGLKITFVPAHGLSGSFCAGNAEVLSVTPCDKDGRSRPRAEPVAASNGGSAAPVGNAGAIAAPPSVNESRIT